MNLKQCIKGWNKEFGKNEVRMKKIRNVCAKISKNTYESCYHKVYVGNFLKKTQKKIKKKFDFFKVASVDPMR